MKKQLEMSRTAKRILSQVLSLVLAMVLVSPVVAPVSAATGYDANAAIAYAKKHWNDGKGLCAEFVSDCINAGGCPVWFYGCTTLVRMLEKSGYGTFYKLDVDSQGRISVPGNRDKLSVGDPVFYYCAKETDGCPYVHAVLYSGEDSSGYLKAYAHNRAKNNEVLYYSNCGYCGAKISTAYVYHMTENYTVTFDAEGGSVYPTSITVPEGVSNWELPTPTRSGYRFKGWCDGPISTVNMVVTDSRVLDITGDKTLHALWTKVGCASHNKDSYKTVKQNGKYTAICKTCDEEFILGSLDTSVKGAYQPVGSYATRRTAPYEKADGKETRGEVQIVGAVKNAYDNIWYKTSDGYWIYAPNLEKVEAKSYTIYFDAEGGKVNTGSMVVTNGKTFGALPTPTRSGYTFGGWWYDDDENGVCVRVDSSTKVNLSGDTTLYAIWSKAECKSHTKGEYLYSADNHPHYNYYECANCGEAVTDKKANQVSNCTTCNPEPEKCTSHTKGNYLFYEAVHPHYYYYECANCGERFTDGIKGKMDSCTTCNPPKAEPTWGEWSDWSTNKVTETSIRQVQTRQVKVSNAYTEYRYGRYLSNDHGCWCGTYLASRPYSDGRAVKNYSPWSTTRYAVYDTGWTCGICSGDHIGHYETDSMGRDFWREYIINGRSFYWEESRTTPAQYRTEYRYRELG